MEPVHLDTSSWRDRQPSDFYPLFLDLWLMGMSQCTVFGMGGFGRFSNMLVTILRVGITIAITRVLYHTALPPYRKKCGMQQKK